MSAGTQTSDLAAAEAQILPRRTRVAILNNFLPPYWLPMLRCLGRRFVSLRLFVSTQMEPNRAWSVDWSGLDVVLQRTLTFGGHWKHPQGFKERLFIHFPIDTIRQLRAFRPDVVISAEMGFRTAMSALYCRLYAGSKLLIWAEIAESTERGRGVLRHILRRVLAKQADAFVVLGDSGARYVKSLHVPDSKVFTIPYATDASRFAQNPLGRTAQQEQRLLYCGQLVERKGLLPFLKVLSEWAEAHPKRVIELSLAGGGPLRSGLLNLSLPTNLKLKLLGNVPYEDLPRIYEDSGIFVFPTLADTWGLVVNEAMASGLPVLGSVYSQAVEMLVVDGQNGWTFRPDDTKQAYHAIDRCLNTPEDVIGRMREHARASAIRFTPERVADLVAKTVVECGGENMEHE